MATLGEIHSVNRGINMDAIKERQSVDHDFFSGRKSRLNSASYDRPKVKKEDLYCIELGTGGYLMCIDNENIGEVKKKENADIFTSAEADDIIRRLWINAKVVPFNTETEAVK